MAMAGQPFTNLVRFEDDSGKILWGDASPDRLDSLVGSTAAVLEGHPLDGGLTRTGKTATIKKVSEQATRANMTTKRAFSLTHNVPLCEI